MVSTPSQDKGYRTMVERGANDQMARNSVSVVLIGGKVFALISHCRHGCGGDMVRGGRKLMQSGWNGTQSTNAGGSIHYYDCNFKSDQQYEALTRNSVPTEYHQVLISFLSCII